MDNPVETPSEVALAAALSQLYGALADADPLAAAPLPVADGAHDITEAFAAAEGQLRARLLLRALDEAIAGLEVAATLADAYAAPTPARPPNDHAEDWSASEPLAATYAAFIASQPAYQGLYHYRNALAAALRMEVRPLPPAVAATAPDKGTTSSTH